MNENNTCRYIITAVVSSVILVGAFGTYLYVQDKINKRKLGGRLIKVDYRYSKEFDD